MSGQHLRGPIGTVVIDCWDGLHCRLEELCHDKSPDPKFVVSFVPAQNPACDAGRCALTSKLPNFVDPIVCCCRAISDRRA